MDPIYLLNWLILSAILEERCMMYRRKSALIDQLAWHLPSDASGIMMALLGKKSEISSQVTSQLSENPPLVKK